MAKSNNNVLTHGLSGKIGDLLVFSQRGGKTIVSNVPRKSNKVSEAQQQHRKKFQQAVLYAKAAQSQPEYETEAVKQGKTPYIVAVADFFNAPGIEQVDFSAYSGQPGDKIRIRATDDFAVKSVTIRITNADGSLVEEGEAQPDPSGFEWIYTATQNNDNLAGDKIEIFASDMPGNIGYDEQVL